MSDLKPLHEIIRPGVPCEVECCLEAHSVKFRFDGTALREWDSPDRVYDVAAMLRPVWRLVPPVQLLKWERLSPERGAQCEGYTIFDTRDGTRSPWRVTHGEDWNDFPTRAECEAWAEAHARDNGK